MYSMTPKVFYFFFNMSIKKRIILRWFQIRGNNLKRKVICQKLLQVSNIEEDKLQETAQNFEKHVLQKCLRIAFYTYIPVNLNHFLKKHHNRCTLLHMYSRAYVMESALRIRIPSGNFSREQGWNLKKCSQYGECCEIISAYLSPIRFNAFSLFSEEDTLRIENGLLLKLYVHQCLPTNWRYGTYQKVYFLG